MKTIWNTFRLNEKAAVLLFALILLISALAPVLAPCDPVQVDMSIRFAEPSAEHLLGTDHLGRDLLSRLMYGGRVSILLSLIATVCSMFAGMMIGLISGYVGGPLDQGISVITSLFQGIPRTCFVIAIVGILKPSTGSLIFALVITSWAGFSRVVRTEVIQVKEKAFMICARSYGSGFFRMMFSHLLPNIADNLIVLFTTRIGQTILSVASLSFLSLGVQPPTPDWGVMINDGRGYFYNNIGLILLPFLCIFAVSWSVNTIGEGLRHYLYRKRDSLEV